MRPFTLCLSPSMAYNMAALPKTSLPSQKHSIIPKLPVNVTQKPLRIPAFSAAIPITSLSPSAPATTTTTESPADSRPRFGPAEPRKGADILVEALERAGVTHVFAYPGGASLEIHQALTRSHTITNHLLRHEQGEAFAAEGYARSTGEPGVCIATSGPGATNLVSALADAQSDSVPLVAITGQVTRGMLGTDAFQETPIVVLTRPITKHNCLVLDVVDIPRIIKEAFFLATTGRPGPVLVDIPKDVQQQLNVPQWDAPMRLPGYLSMLPKPPARDLIDRIVRLISESKRPVLYVGGGCSAAGDELRRFVELTGIPVASTLMGLGCYPTDDVFSLKMLGMHGTAYANYAVDRSDLLLAFGVRFDDSVTGELEAFASRAKIVHIDIDCAEIGKNKQPHVSICADIRPSLQELNEILEAGGPVLDFAGWREELDEQKKSFPLVYRTFGDCIPPQYAIQVLDELTCGEAIISTGVGLHQMWAAQYYTYRRPRRWISSCGLGAMGFGLPAAAGAAVGNPGVTVVDIDDDGSFLMNIQELAMIRIENLPVKAMILNNQHLGNEDEIYPDYVTIADGFDIPAARVTKKGEVRGAIQKMLDTPGPYLLDIVVPHHVLPMGTEKI